MRPCKDVRKIGMMIGCTDVRRARWIWWADLLSTLVCLGAVIGAASLGRLPANPPLSPQVEVALRPAPSEISLRAGDPLNEAVAEVRAPLVRYLIRELIAERLGDAQLSADLEIGGLAPHGAQLADTTAARAAIEAGLEEQARVTKKASARARRQDEATKDHVRERDRKFANVRSEAEDSHQRPSVGYTGLKRKGAENYGLTTEPAAVRTNPAAAMASTNPATFEDQRRAFHPAAGDTPGDRPEPKPRLIGRASAPTSGTVDNGVPVRAGTIPVIRNDTSMRASSLKVGVSDSEPTTVHATSTSPDGPEFLDMRSRAALAPAPSASSIEAPDKGGARKESAGPPQGGGWLGLDQAAARLADGLRVTREEAISQGQERVFTVDVEERAFSAASIADSVSLDPAFHIHLFTAKSELVGGNRGGIRFFANGSSTGGRIELELLGERAAINVQWATGIVTVERWSKKPSGRGA
jgi:general secretion pathway protein H